MRRHATAFVHAAAAMWLWLPVAATAQTPQAGLNATVVAATPWAQGEGRSLQLSLEPHAKWQMAHADWRWRQRLRWREDQGQQRSDADVRELSATWRSGNTSLALGAQQLQWGRIDIVRVADLINPVDQQDLFVDELPQAKLAAWMGSWEWQDGTSTLQVVAVPRPGIDRLPARLSGLPVRSAQPPTTWANTTWAARYGLEAGGWSADLIAVRGWQTSPTLVPVVAGNAVHLQAAVSRQYSLAVSADKPLGPALLRVEALHARLRPEASSAAPGPQAGFQNTLSVGLDLRPGAWFVAGQIVAQRDVAWASRSRNTALLSAIVQRKWLQDRLAGRLVVARDTRSASSWGSLQLRFEWSPNVVMQIQADKFQGDSPQAFGGLLGHSRVAGSMHLQY